MGSEACDDGNDIDTDACTTCTITQAVCGNAIVEGNEACDDGNDADGRAGSEYISASSCGLAAPAPSRREAVSTRGGVAAHRCTTVATDNDVGLVAPLSRRVYTPHASPPTMNTPWLRTKPSASTAASK